MNNSKTSFFCFANDEMLPLLSSSSVPSPSLSLFFFFFFRFIIFVNASTTEANIAIVRVETSKEDISFPLFEKWYRKTISHAVSVPLASFIVVASTARVELYKSSSCSSSPRLSIAEVKASM